MPVFNGARYVAEALDSWLAQDLRDFELVVSDNASTDATPAILAAYAARDERVRVVRRAQTVMALENFNGLVKEARAPLFTWGACDDLREPAFLRRMVETLDADPERVLAYCDARYFGDRVRVGSHLPSDDVVPPGTRGGPLERAISTLRVGGWIPVYGVIRTDALRRTRLFYYPMGIAADVGLVAELAALGRLACVREELMAWRLRADSLSRDLSDPIHFGAPGRRFDAGVRAFVEGLPLSERERRIFLHEAWIYCRKGHKPRRGLWRLSGFRSAVARAGRWLVDLECFLNRPSGG
jgi:hypothetical protein